jgi:SWI/SNF related-matrix-associated actin-dependent regulator of chromatin subfamily C
VAQAAATAAINKLKADKKAPSSPGKESAVEKAAATALGASAAKSFTLASHEEIEMQKITRVLIETQLKKMELKLNHFQEIEAILDHERQEIEHERHQLYLDRLEFKNGNVNGSGANVEAVAVDIQGDIDMTPNKTLLPLN